MGTEVKSLRAGHANLKDSFARVEGGEAWLFNMHISPYEAGNRFNHEAKRQRRLLLHKSEIMRIYSRVREKGLTLVPTRLYFKQGRVKVELALAQGKHLYDKRDDMAERAAQRDIERTMKEQRGA